MINRPAPRHFRDSDEDEQENSRTLSKERDIKIILKEITKIAETSRNHENQLQRLQAQIDEILNSNREASPSQSEENLAYKEALLRNLSNIQIDMIKYQEMLQKMINDNVQFQKEQQEKLDDIQMFIPAIIKYKWFQFLMLFSIALLIISNGTLILYIIGRR
jgi:hypothetical protein